MADEVLRVADIVATASLDVRVLAGGSGLGREVLWAHSCEMQEPTRYLSPHDLLMTVGLCVPHEPDEQVAFLGRLDDAGLSGMMIGDHAPAPVLHPELFAEADRREFPVLLAGEHTAYAVVARHVAAANWSSQSLQVMRLSKLYHVATYADRDLPSLLDELASVLGVGLSIRDDVTGIVVAGSAAADVAEGATTPHRYRLHGAYPAELVVAEYPGEQVDSFLLVHLIKMLEVAADSVLSAADHLAQSRAAMLRALLNGAVPLEVPEALAPHPVSDGFRLVAFPRDDHAAVARALAVRGTAVIAGPGRTCGLALVPTAETAAFREVIEQLGSRAGVSSVFVDELDTRAAAEEAKKVLEAASHTDQSWSEFEGSTLSVLTRSRREAADIVTGVLGPLAEPGQRADMLRETLFAYLRNDRHWDRTAAELGIHRQTLSYRLKRILEETGMDPARTADLSALWIASQAWGMLRGEPAAR